MILADLHIHTKFSDGMFEMNEIIDLYGKAGFDVIAITDHITSFKNIPGWFAKKLKLTVTEETFSDYYKTFMREKERAWKQYKMLVIPGYELSHNTLNFHHNFHIVALGMDRFISADQAPEQITRQIRALGGVSIAAHPVHTGDFEPQTFYLWEHRDELSMSFDAWETANGKRFFDQVYESGLPIIANSDLHKIEQMSSWRIEINAKKTEASVFQAIQHQDLELVYYEHETGQIHWPMRQNELQAVWAM